MSAEPSYDDNPSESQSCAQLPADQMNYFQGEAAGQERSNTLGVSIPGDHKSLTCPHDEKRQKRFQQPGDNSNVSSLYNSYFNQNSKTRGLASSGQPSRAESVASRSSRQQMWEAASATSEPARMSDLPQSYSRDNYYNDNASEPPASAARSQRSERSAPAPAQKAASPPQSTEPSVRLYEVDDVPVNERSHRSQESDISGWNPKSRPLSGQPRSRPESAQSKPAGESHQDPNAVSHRSQQSNAKSNASSYRPEDPRKQYPAAQRSAAPVNADQPQEPNRSHQSSRPESQQSARPRSQPRSEQYDQQSQSGRPQSQQSARPQSQQSGRPQSQQSGRPESQHYDQHSQSGRPESQQSGRPRSQPRSEQYDQQSQSGRPQSQQSGRPESQHYDQQSQSGRPQSRQSGRPESRQYDQQSQSGRPQSQQSARPQSQQSGRPESRPYDQQSQSGRPQSSRHEQSFNSDGATPVRMSSEAGVKEVDPNETYSSHHSSHHPARKAVWEESSQGTEANCTFQPRVSRGPERVPDDEEDKPAPAPVFSRLYADAQRYNRQRTEREKALELQQQMRNGEIPYDREALVNAGLAIDSDDDFEVQRGDHDGPQNAQRNTAVPGEEPRRRSVNPEVFDRLARPTQVTLKREQQKELEEQRKKEEEEKRAEDRKREMAEVTTYQWELPARSYTMADIHRQNALYVQ